MVEFISAIIFLLIYFIFAKNSVITENLESEEDTMNATKKNFIPTDSQQRDLLLKIQKSVCESDFMDKFRFNLIPETFDIFTVVIEFMEGIHSILIKNDITTVNIGDLIIIEKTFREKRTSEKSGNINCKMTLGTVGEDVANNGASAFTDSAEDDIELRKTMLAASALAVKELEDYNVRGIKPEDVYHMVIAFFTYMISTTMEIANNGSVSPEDFKLDIGVSELSYFRVRYAIKKNKPVIAFNPGPKLKTTVKSDSFTE